MRDPTKMERLLTAAEGADAVAARFRSGQAPDPEEVPPYCCEGCGSDEFKVHWFSGSQGRTGWLTDEHQIEWDDDDPCYIEDEQERWEIRCFQCDHEAEFGWSHPPRRGGLGGRIWPCKSADFNPLKCFPEPRFVKEWGRRGWLRPKR
jgi:hypothetical protein